MKITDWLAHATADAESRGLTELVPLLQTLARSTEALRAADAAFGHPAAEYADKQATEYTEYTEQRAADHNGSH
jgi:hypothetical protein